MSHLTEEQQLIRGDFTPVNKLSKQQLQIECQMWRSIWLTTPPEVKYYLARMGTLCAITMRNYKRHIGILGTQHWDLKELELGVFERTYDSIKNKYYLEEKILKVPTANIVALEWISKREEESQLAETPEETEPENAPSDK